MGENYSTVFFLYEDFAYQIFEDVLDILSEKNLDIETERTYDVREDQRYLYLSDDYRLLKNSDYDNVSGYPEAEIGTDLSDPTAHKIFLGFETLGFEFPKHDIRTGTETYQPEKFNSEKVRKITEITESIIRDTEPYFAICLDQARIGALKGDKEIIGRKELEEGEFELRSLTYLSNRMIDSRNDFTKEDVLNAPAYETKEIEGRGVLLRIERNPVRYPGNEKLDEVRNCLGFKLENERRYNLESSTLKLLSKILYFLNFTKGELSARRKVRREVNEKTSSYRRLKSRVTFYLELPSFLILYALRGITNAVKKKIKG